MNRRERWQQTVRMELLLLAGVLAVELLVIFFTKTGADVLPADWDILEIFKWTLAFVCVMAAFRVLSGVFLGVYKRSKPN